MASSGSHKLLIFGSGGSGREIAAWAPRANWDAAQFELLGFIDDNAEQASVNGVAVLSLASAALLHPDACVIVAVGDPAVRRRLVQAASDAGLKAAPPLIHPSVEIADGLVKLGDGVVICPGAVVTVNVEIAAHVQVNVHCSVMHDARIGEYVTLSPAARINGNVHVGEGAFIGAGAVTLNGVPGAPLTIGAGSVIGAGAVVTKDVAPGVTVTGVPARVRSAGLAG